MSTVSDSRFRLETLTAAELTALRSSFGTAMDSIMNAGSPSSTSSAPLSPLFVAAAGGAGSLPSAALPVVHAVTDVTLTPSMLRALAALTLSPSVSKGRDSK